MNENANHTSEKRYTRESDWVDRLGIAAHLRVSPRHITNQQRRRMIPYHRIGRCIRFKISEVEGALNTSEINSIGHF